MVDSPKQAERHRKRKASALKANPHITVVFQTNRLQGQS
jgi:hypothetical protein